jgi:hypothetical protein
MTTQSNNKTTPSILCDEPGCNDYAKWKITYDLDEMDEFVESYACDLHVGEGCDPEGPNIVKSIFNQFARDAEDDHSNFGTM